MDALILAFAYAATGSAIGCALGLVPGMHSNNVALALSLLLLPFVGALNFGCMLMGVLVAHVFTSFIPSTFLGAPEGEVALSVLPAHRLMLAGKGFEAVNVHAKGAVGGLIASLLMLPLFRIILGSPFELYDLLSFAVPFALILIEFMLVASEPSRVKWRTKIVVTDDEPPEEYSSIIEILKDDGYAGQNVKLRGKVVRVRKSGCIIEDGFASIKVDSNGNFNVGEECDISGIVDHEKVELLWRKRGLALLYFLLTGAFGYIVLNSAMFDFFVPIPLERSGAVFLLPMFAGMFGIAGMAMSLLDKASFPVQDVNEPDKDTKFAPRFAWPAIAAWRINLSSKVKYLKGVFAGAVTGGLIGFYPGMSSAHASMVAKWAAGRDSDGERARVGKVGANDDTLDGAKEFISMLSAVNGANVVFNLLALFVIFKTRSGAMSYLESALEEFDGWLELQNIPQAFSLMLFSAFVGCALAYPVTIGAGRLFAMHYHKLDYTKMTIFVMVFLVIMVALFSGPVGIFIMCIGAAIGISSQALGVRRVHLMGCIAVPVILFYLW